MSKQDTKAQIDRLTAEYIDGMRAGDVPRMVKAAEQKEKLIVAARTGRLTRAFVTAALATLIGACTSAVAPATVEAPACDAPPPVEASEVHLGDACESTGAHACDAAQPAICTGARWVFNSQRCDLPDCWTPSPLAVGGCVAGCFASTGTCIQVAQ